MKASLPPSLGIVYNGDDDEEDNDVPGMPPEGFDCVERREEGLHDSIRHQIHVDVVAIGTEPTREDLLDFVDLHELGGTVSWPSGWHYNKAVLALKSGSW